MNKEDIFEPWPCKECRKNPPEPGYEYPLCPSCREKLRNRPFPIWVTIVIIIIVALMSYSASKFPIVLKAGQAQKAAKKAEERNDYQSAIVEYQKVLALFPESDRHKEGLAICYIKTGETKKALDVLFSIKNKLNSAHVLKELGFKIK